jgi:hypothetical protein
MSFSNPTNDAIWNFGEYLAKLAADLHKSGMEATAADMAHVALFCRELVLNPNDDAIVALLEAEPNDMLRELLRNMKAGRILHRG